MHLLPAAVTALHLLILLLFFIATLDKGWWVLPDSQPLNLWYDCAPQNRSQGWECSSLGLSPLLRGVQGLMVSALLLSAFGLLLFLWQLLAGPRGRLFLPSAAAQLLAGLAALLGAGLFVAGGGRGQRWGPPRALPSAGRAGRGLGSGQRGRVPAAADTRLTTPTGYTPTGHAHSGNAHWAHLLDTPTWDTPTDTPTGILTWTMVAGHAHPGHTHWTHPLTRPLNTATFKARWTRLPWTRPPGTRPPGTRLLNTPFVTPTWGHIHWSHPWTRPLGYAHLRHAHWRRPLPSQPITLQ
ncbi:uncharacterized protein [Agelaius tricolor]|uniref:uncharacterized protein n=1 Tax=Agelaius tricolor TaxID=9191 RepID=UPI0039F199DC